MAIVRRRTIDTSTWNSPQTKLKRADRGLCVGEQLLTIADEIIRVFMAFTFSTYLNPICFGDDFS